MRRMTMVVPVMLVGLLAIAGGSDRPIEAGESIDQFATRCKPCVWEGEEVLEAMLIVDKILRSETKRRRT